ncbi:MAG: NADH-quinone oxidoreductase subunit NuoG [Pseudomonadota bacterium]
MSDDTVTLEIDGKTVQAKKGQMLIEATDAAQAYVPRFCYHKKLSVAANCRMCLVEVERAPKPLPACATPVADGMVVKTKSRYAISAQRATMEFLLINHPLDCPICDQGGECELQDLAMGYGRDISRYTERKRVVKDKNIGPLVSTDMTRCIHCTRCVRFGKEIQGIQELGTTGRGENMQIGTYIEQNVDHELSGNIIDLCPVGALNNKPYRFSARSWEMIQQPIVGAHDCVGSNLFAHTLRGTVKRIVPRPNEAINETWISDRDRFSYEGIYSEDRLMTPRMRVDGEWREASWGEALDAAAEALRRAGTDTGFIVSPSATLEEGYLLNGLATHLGTADIDHRITRRDVADQAADPAFPWLGMALEDLDQLDAALVVGSRLRKEVPIIAHRLRKAVVDNSAKVATLESSASEYFFPTIAQTVGGLAAGLAAIVKAAADLSGQGASNTVASLIVGASVDSAARDTAQALIDGERALVLFGLEAGAHAAFSELRLLGDALSTLTGATVGYLSEGANSAGLSLAGVLPHRTARAALREATGRSVGEMLAQSPKCLVLWNVEPDIDLAAFAGTPREGKPDTVIACTPYFGDGIAAEADIVLPIGTFAETAGTFVNVEGRAQSWQGIAKPVGEARPGWKVLRVLGTALEAPDFDFNDAAEVATAAQAVLSSTTGDNRYGGNHAARRVNGEDAAAATLERPIYEVDATVRRAQALQQTEDGIAGQAWRGSLRGDAS